MKLKFRHTLAAVLLVLGATAAFAGGVGFRDSRHLHQHFQKHGREFGNIGESQYRDLAVALRDARIGGDILELRRPDGSRCRFDRRSGAFLAFDSSGTIRTFFRPRDGERYFNRQARRGGG